MSVNNLTEITGKSVYTKSGKFVGKIEDTMLDTERGSIAGFVIQMAPDSYLYKMFEKGGNRKAILVPHRHVLSCDDIVIISVPAKYEQPNILPQKGEEVATVPGDAGEI